jgi:hypothetical protein
MRINSYNPKNQSRIAFKRLEIVNIHQDFIGKVPKKLDEFCKNEKWPAWSMKTQDKTAPLGQIFYTVQIATKAFSDLELDLYNAFMKNHLLGENAKCKALTDEIPVKPAVEHALK